MRVFTGGLHHESDTFNPLITGWDDIRVERDFAGADNSIQGIIDTLRSAGCTVVTGLHARAVPNGVWSRECYDRLSAELLDSLSKSLPVDGICLALHGSMMVEGLGKAEDDLLSRIRALCPDTPVYASLDMHCTFSDRMAGLADCFIGYKRAPHTDEYATGVAVARLLLERLSGVRHYMAHFRIPVLIAGEKSETGTEPMRSLIRRLEEMEAGGECASASYLLGFPWADSPDAGVTALVVSRTSRSDALSKAVMLARSFWCRRRDFSFCTRALDMDSALEETVRLIRTGACPVVLSDSGDNPTAGGSQDVTVFLKKILSDEVLSHLDPPLVYQAVYDPQVVEMAFRAGTGALIDICLGSRFYPAASTPVRARASVRALSDGWDGDFSCPLALLSVGGVDVVVTSAHVGCYEPAMMRSLGVDPSERSVIAVKLGYLEPELRSMAASSILVLSPGATNEVLETIAYKNVPRPVFPLDSDFSFSFPAVEEHLSPDR